MSSLPHRRLALAALLGCTAPREPGLTVVLLPKSAYGPFDAGIVRVVADGGPDGAPVVRVAHQAVRCFDIDEVDPEDKTASPPFDNCPLVQEGERFAPKETSERRALSPNACCYVKRRRPRVIIPVDEE